MYVHACVHACAHVCMHVYYVCVHYLQYLNTTCREVLNKHKHCPVTMLVALSVIRAIHIRRCMYADVKGM